MLDSFKNSFGGSGKQKQADELQTLIAAAKEERGALSAMLTQISVRSSKLAQMGKTLEQVSQKADTATATVEDLNKKVSGLDERLGTLEDRTAAVLEAARDVPAVEHVVSFGEPPAGALDFDAPDGVSYPGILSE